MKKIFAILFAFLGITQCVVAQNTTTTASPNVNEQGVILGGYDAVSFLQLKKAEKGTATHAVFYSGATYFFTSAAHKEVFKKSPAAFAPQYGGWCAYAMGNSNELVEIDPETFKIVDGKLYLFYNKYFTNTLKLWNKDEGRLKSTADKNWSKRLALVK
jgi:YHS domain-containing protein